MNYGKLDDAFSLFIRHRDTVDGIGFCATCNKPLTIKTGQCGHFISRRHLSTRWDEKNCAIQCVSCNIFNQGKQFEFSMYIEKKHGKGTCDLLTVKSRLIKKPSQFEIDTLRNHYLELVKKM